MEKKLNLLWNKRDEWHPVLKIVARDKVLIKGYIESQEDYTYEDYYVEVWKLDVPEDDYELISHWDDKLKDWLES